MFPLNACLGEEAIARPTRFGKRLIVAIAVISDRRSANECSWLALRWHGGKVRAKISRADHAAVMDAAFFRGGPQSEHGIAGQMYDGVKLGRRQSACIRGMWVHQVPLDVF